MRVLATLPQDDLNDVPAAARAAEAAGYDGLVTMENRNEPFLALGVAAVTTTRIGLATGIAIAFARSPMAVANASWDLQRASRGRFVLGLGSQVRFGGAADTVALSGGYGTRQDIPPDLIQDLQRIPTAFTGSAPGW